MAGGERSQRLERAEKQIPHPRRVRNDRAGRLGEVERQDQMEVPPSNNEGGPGLELVRGGRLARQIEERFLHCASRQLRRSEAEEEASARFGRNDTFGRLVS
jgi:hypothetical protein